MVDASLVADVFPVVDAFPRHPITLPFPPFHPVSGIDEQLQKPSLPRKSIPPVHREKNQLVTHCSHERSNQFSIVGNLAMLFLAAAFRHDKGHNISIPKIGCRAPIARANSISAGPA